MRLAIQGGPGSFNEEAAREYLSQSEREAKLDYRYTSAEVTAALLADEAGLGLMAIENSVGGVVYESIEALAAGEFRVVKYRDILVVHALLTRPGVGLAEIDAIISHPQALKQCRQTLAEKYPEIAKRAGDGEMLDQATAAKALAAGELPDTTAVLASRVCADLYDLDIAASGLQDSDDNLTTFLVIERG